MPKVPTGPQPYAQRWSQFEVKVLAGAEPWLLVRHAGKCFKLPADAPLSQLLEGVAHGWDMNARKTRGAPPTVRMRLDQYLDLQHQAETGRRASALVDELVPPTL